MQTSRRLLAGLLFLPRLLHYRVVCCLFVFLNSEITWMCRVIFFPWLQVRSSVSSTCRPGFKGCCKKDFFSRNFPPFSQFFLHQAVLAVTRCVLGFCCVLAFTRWLACIFFLIGTGEKCEMTRESVVSKMVNPWKTEHKRMKRSWNNKRLSKQAWETGFQVLLQRFWDRWVPMRFLLNCGFSGFQTSFSTNF